MTKEFKGLPKVGDEIFVHDKNEDEVLVRYVKAIDVEGGWIYLNDTYTNSSDDTVNMIHYNDPCWEEIESHRR